VSSSRRSTAGGWRADLVAFCKERLTGYKVPRVVEFKDELPITAAGKLLRRLLKN